MGIVEAHGIVTREIKYGDTSRILTVITREFGKISVLATGARTNKSGLLAATQLFSYVSFTLFKGREKSLYKINSGEIESSFSKIRNSLERMAYASYFCDITNYVVQEDSPDTEQLNLLLNCLYMLAEDKLSYNMIKAVFEFRTLAIQGLVPDLTVCGDCTTLENLIYIDTENGCALCEKCGEKKENLIRTGRAVINTIEYIAEAESKKIFAFKIPENLQKYMSDLGEYLIEKNLEKHFKTLDYLKSVQLLED